VGKTAKTVSGARWLEEREYEAWRSFIMANSLLMAALEADLAPFGLTMGDYEVLVTLSEAPERRLRMCDLAALLQLSPSGLTRRLDGLVRDGAVERIPSSTDRRVQLAWLTDHGMARLRAAAPTHVASVRRHLIDGLSDRQLDALRDVFTSVRDRLVAAESA
jgi:DNA-binding MarR family transcriptional regulator